MLMTMHCSGMKEDSSPEMQLCDCRYDYLTDLKKNLMAAAAMIYNSESSRSS